MEDSDAQKYIQIIVTAHKILQNIISIIKQKFDLIFN